MSFSKRQIADLFLKARNKSKWEKRELVNAVFYFVKNGRKWHNLPHDFPPHNFYYAAVKSGLWEKLLAALVERNESELGENYLQIMTFIDSQSVKTTGAAEECEIDDGGK